MLVTIFKIDPRQLGNSNMQMPEQNMSNIMLNDPMNLNSPMIPGATMQQPGYPMQQPGYPMQQPGYPTNFQQPMTNFQQPMMNNNNWSN
jgi:hypothetical protein